MNRARFAALTACVALFGLPAFAAAGMEEGRASAAPWSGYWWPHSEGRMIRDGGPLTKYDLATGKKARDWEQNAHPMKVNGKPVEGWFGYCHAWSASSVMEPEPTKSITVARQGGAPVVLNVGDQKGLYALCHAKDVVNFYGRRNERGSQDAETYQDLRPGQLWQLLRQYVQQGNAPLIMDIDAGPPVWNYPVYAYRVEWAAFPAGGPGVQLAKLTLWMADDAVGPDYIGTKVRQEKYQFTFKQAGNGSVLMNTAQWYGSSVRDHPDFAWYPQTPVAENPEVKYAAVKKMLTGKDVADGPPPMPPPMPEPMRPTAPSPTFVAEADNPPQPADFRDPERTPAWNRDRTGQPQEALKVTVVSPQDILTLIANQTSAFAFDVTVDKFDGGKYVVEEAISVNGSVAKDGFLYLFHLDPDGKVKLLFPLKGQDNRVSANKKIEVGTANDKTKAKFVCTGPPGTHRIKALVTTKPLALTGLDQQQQGQDDGGPNQPAQTGQSQGFRWNPEQEKQVQEVVQQLGTGKKKYDEVAKDTGIKPDKTIGEFAQDEIAFYVGPKDKPKPGDDKPKPSDDKPKDKPKPGQEEVKPKDKPADQP